MANELYEIPVKTIDGEETTLNDYKGKTLLIVNVASQCGLTPQYEGLQKLYSENKDKGFEILGFPANNYLGQEPGTDEEIKDFDQLMAELEASWPPTEKMEVIKAYGYFSIDFNKPNQILEETK